MHRDKKLGLVLGVMLIGFAGAFCFPKARSLDSAIPQLEGAAELDADIEFLPVRAYTGLDASQAPAHAGLAATDRQSARDVPAAPPVLVAATGDAFGQPLATAPDPIELPGRLSPPAPPSSPALDSQREGPVERDGAAGADALVYVVQPGDTLSGLALRFLGSSQRYQELYMANRDVLSSPDDLRAGIKLKLPQAPGSTAEAPRPPSTPRTDEPATGESSVKSAGLPGSSSSSTRVPSQVSASRDRAMSPAAVGVRGRFRSIGQAPPAEGTQVTVPEFAPPVNEIPAAAADTLAERAISMDATDPRRASSTYHVRPGDNLETIALRLYGDREAVRRLWRANASEIKDPNRLQPGTTLIVPP